MAVTAAGVSLRQDAGGLALLDVANAQASATIALQGAQLLEWTPRGTQSVIWLSPAAKLIPGKAVRGGVPICWPWFGAHAKEAAFPAHGFARTALWELLETSQRADGATCLALRLQPGAATQAWWPYASQLELHLAVGETLELELLTRNTGSVPFTFSAALHAYFAVGDVRQATIHGLDGCPYLDKTDGGRRRQQSGPITIAAEVDRIYLESRRAAEKLRLLESRHAAEKLRLLESGADCLIDDPVLKRRIRIEKRGSRSSVVWNPWQEKAAQLGDLGEDGYLRMLCLESGNVADDAVSLAPGGEHRVWVRYSIAAGP